MAGDPPGDGTIGGARGATAITTPGMQDIGVPPGHLDGTLAGGRRGAGVMALHGRGDPLGDGADGIPLLSQLFRQHHVP